MKTIISQCPKVTNIKSGGEGGGGGVLGFFYIAFIQAVLKLESLPLEAKLEDVHV